MGTFKKSTISTKLEFREQFLINIFIFGVKFDFFQKDKKILRTDFYFNRAKMYENDWWTERLPLLRPSAGFKPRKFPLHREKAGLTSNLSLNNGSQLKNPDFSGALSTLRIQYSYTQTQCEDGARDVRVLLLTPVTSL